MKLHHIGYIVKDIDAFETNLVCEKKVAEALDTIQKARLALYTNFSDSYIELIQPLSEDSFTYNALQKTGNSYHHVCYTVDSKEEFADIADKRKLVVIKNWMPASLFNEKLVCFCYTRNKTIVEFLLDKE